MKSQKLKFTILLSLALSIVSCKKDEIENTTTTDSVAKTYEGIEFKWKDVTNSTTGKTWMDRNLGAKQVAKSSTDEDAYGDLYQWGRGSDGHECRNSDTTSILSESDTPEHPNFITEDSEPYDWMDPQKDSLWQGVDGVNNPCPTGYRLPTKTEWEEEIESWNSKDSKGAFGSVLKLPMAGFRCSADGSGSIYYVGSRGGYWSSTVSGSLVSFLRLYDSSVDVGADFRGDGTSVRCIKD